MRKTLGQVVFARSSTTVMGGLLLVLFWSAAPALGQAPSVFQLRVAGTCPVGYSIRVVNQDGTVECQQDTNSGGTVTEVTASHPLHSTGGTTPNISLPDVVIGIVLRNTAIGHDALSQNIDGIDNTASGTFALFSNSTGVRNSASGGAALQDNTGGRDNTASGYTALHQNQVGNGNTGIGGGALFANINGSFNTALGVQADVSAPNLINATAIGSGALVDASDKVRIGNANVSVIEGQVAFTFSSDRNLKEHFKPLDGQEVLNKIRQIPVQSWNYIRQNPGDFRHYGPVAQDFFAAFGNDGIGTVGTPTTINSGDMAGILMAAIKELEARTAELKEGAAKMAELEARLKSLERLIQDRD